MVCVRLGTTQPGHLRLDARGILKCCVIASDSVATARVQDTCDCHVAIAPRNDMLVFLDISHLHLLFQHCQRFFKIGLGFMDVFPGVLYIFKAVFKRVNGKIGQ